MFPHLSCFWWLIWKWVIVSQPHTVNHAVIWGAGTCRWVSFNSSRAKLSLRAIAELRIYRWGGNYSIKTITSKGKYELFKHLLSQFHPARIRIKKRRFSWQSDCWASTGCCCFWKLNLISGACSSLAAPVKLQIKYDRCVSRLSVTWANLCDSQQHKLQTSKFRSEGAQEIEIKHNILPNMTAEWH